MDDRIAVIGAGLMGAGIAQVFAARGYPVTVFDPLEEARAALPGRIAANLRLLSAPALPEDLVRTEATLPAAVAGATVVFEAAPEKLALKQSIFAELATATGPDCILASNTSVIPITRIAEPLPDAGRVIGTHWWNPPFLVPLVEVVAAERSGQHYVDRMMELLARVGKKPVRVRRDVPGFVGNRLQHALWREAQALIADGVCDAETVDDVVKNSFGLRLAVLGPIENADLVGLDLTLDIHRTIIPELSSLSGPNPLLEQLVDQGRLGFKTGGGFRDWTPEQVSEVRERLLRHLQQAVRGTD
ncbi:MAG: 3-hydroxyacyl-CoA dehydrogenase family protein [Gammaproteobacteria bacterium]|nr:MAG: 3-hydroxyacyl-CoA dehydrogenase family protein [Gammaproteobacteria bacterium]